MSDLDRDFLEIFRDEARGRLDRIVETLLALESGTAGAGALDALFRDTHTIKGAAGMVGLDEIGALAHVMEDLLAQARDSAALPAELIEPLLRASDALRAHVEGNGEMTSAHIAELTAARVTAGGQAAQPESAAPTLAPAPGPETPAAASAPVPQTLAPAPATQAPQSERRSIRVPAEKIDSLLDLVGETVLHRRRRAVARRAEGRGDRHADAPTVVDRHAAAARSA
jgi:two-component system chemotaxis sensor kinase CheA